MKLNDYWTYEKSLELCRQLSYSQGFYQRLYDQLIRMKPEQQDSFTQVLQIQKIRNAIDFILFIEQEGY